MASSRGHLVIKQMWLCILLLPLIHVYCPTCAYESQNVSQDRSTAQLPVFRGDSFKLSARIRLFKKEDLDVSVEVALNEFYSNTLEKAKLSINEQSFSETGLVYDKIDYYFDKKSNTLINSKRKPFSNRFVCQQVNDSQLVQDLFGSVANEANELSDKFWLSKAAGVPEHVIGLARLLLFIDQNRNKLTPDDTHEPAALIRNHEVVKHKLTFTSWAGSEATMHIWSSNDTPLKVWIQLASGSELTVDYYFIEPIGKKTRTSEGARRAYNIVDTFTLPLGAACSARMRRAFEDSWKTSAQMGSTQQQVVSFKMILNRIAIQETTHQLAHLFVAYDGYAKTLRTDTIGEPGNGYTVTIHDTLANRRYNMKQLATTSGSGPDKLSQTNDRNQCCATISFITDEPESFYDEPIIPFFKLAEMGQAIVRGVTTRVFERVTQSLPRLLFQHVSFRYSSGKFAAVLDLKYPEEYTDYTINYFISFGHHQSKADNKSSGGDPFDGAKLMRVDVSMYGSLLYRAEIYDFIWQLTDAPNGDKQDQLFALKDQCFAPSGRAGNKPDWAPNKSGTLTMELVHRGSPKMSYLGTNKLMALVKDAPVRNKALVRGLSQLKNSISASEIRGIKSRVHLVNSTSGGTSLTIVASLQLMHERPKLYIPVSMGTGAWLGGREKKATQSATLDECMWEAARLSTRFKSLVFSFCYTICLIDIGAQVESVSGRTKLVYSDIFQVNPSYPCHLLYFDVQDDTGASQQWNSWSYIYETLRNKLVELPLIDARPDESANQVVSLSFEVERLELNNVKWWRSHADADDQLGTTGTRPSAELEGALDGVGLVADGYVNQLAKVGGDGSHWSPAMDVSTCHAHCVANLDCRSYSTCVTSRQVECVISALDFGNSSLLMEFRTRAAELRKTGVKRAQVWLDNTSRGLATLLDDTSSGPNSTAPPRVELKLDARCRIHNKRALELFRQLPRSATTLVSRNLFAAADEEHCAEMCLERNAKFFRRMARARAKMLERQEAGESALDLDQWRSQLMDDMRYWCAIFRYVDLDQVSYKIIGRIGRDKVGKRGVCMLARPSWAPRTMDNGGQQRPDNASERAGRVEMESFEFLYHRLYERQPAVRLLGSVAEPTNTTGYIINQQKVEQHSEYEKCARACFSQSINLTPWCRSFDLLESRFDNRTSYYCLYNSMTLAEAAKSNQVLITNQSGSVKFWHFEPRPSYTLDSVVLSHMLEPPDAAKQTIGASAFERVFVWLAAIATGLFLSLAIMSRLTVTATTSALDQARLSLSLPEGVSFVNRDQLQEVRDANEEL